MSSTVINDSLLHNYPQQYCHESRSAWNQCLRHFQVLKFTSWADRYFVVLNANTSRSRLGLATSRARSRLESRTSRLGQNAQRLGLVSISDSCVSGLVSVWKVSCTSLLVVNSNYGPILHRFWDMATYWLKIASTPLPFGALAPYVPFGISRRS